MSKNEGRHKKEAPATTFVVITGAKVGCDFLTYLSRARHACQARVGVIRLLSVQ